MQLDAAQITRLVSEHHSALAPAHSPAPEIFIHDILGSTNDEAARLLATDCAAPLVVIARRQTRGRGRFGRPWLSEPNGNLYISFGFRPRVAPARLQTFTLWAGVVVCDFIAAHMRDMRDMRDVGDMRDMGNMSDMVAAPPPRATPGVKWPNDIFFGARKVGGLLAEARAVGGSIENLVFGLGLNLKLPAAGWPPELAATATSLAEQPGGAIADANAFVAALITRVIDAHARLLENPAATAAALAALWQKHDLLRGKTITALSGTERITGVADGIDAGGSLILRLPDATTRKIRAGEVTLEKNPNHASTFG